MSDIASAIVKTMSQPVLVLESDLQVALVNRAFLQSFGVDATETEGKFVFDLGNGQWDIPDLRQLLTELLTEESSVSDFRVEQDFETIGPRTMMVNAVKLDQEGHKRILLAIDDITDRELREHELAARQEFADKLIDSIREGLVVLKHDLTVERVNQSFCEMFEVSSSVAVGKRIYELGNGQWDIPELRKALGDILPEQNAFDDFRVTHDFPAIGHRTMLLNARRLDHMPRILLAIRDETAREQCEKEQQLLIGEVQHRVKNILGNVQSIANATIRRSPSLDAFKETFTERLQSLARAQDLLMRGAKGVAELKNLLTFELQAHGWEVDGRLSINGPKVLLTREQTQSVAMILHELTTNAVKYGAFSGSSGRLDVSWALVENKRLDLDWRESGVSIDGPPKEMGFGTGMIQNSISHSLDGECRLEFRPDGLICQFTLPLDPKIQEIS